MQTRTGSDSSSSHRGLVIVGILFMQLLLMGAAFVGGRLIAAQNLRATGQASALPAQLPKESPAGSGTVQKIEDNSITLARASAGSPGGPPGSEGQTVASTTSQAQVAVSTDTKYYKSTSVGMPGMPGDSGSQSQVQIQDAALGDVKVGNTVTVWGTKDGDRIAAQVVYIQSFGR